MLSQIRWKCVSCKTFKRMTLKHQHLKHCWHYPFSVQNSYNEFDLFNAFNGFSLENNDWLSLAKLAVPNSYLLFISYKFVKGFLAITFLLLFFLAETFMMCGNVFYITRNNISA